MQSQKKGAGEKQMFSSPFSELFWLVLSYIKPLENGANLAKKKNIPSRVLL